jgi:hypothetical protein
MASNPEFDRILKLIGPKELEEYYADPAVSPNEKEGVRRSTPDVQRRLVAGYYIRTNKKLKTARPAAAKKAVGTGLKTKKRIDRTTILGRREATYKHGAVVKIDPKTGERIEK